FRPDFSPPWTGRAHLTQLTVNRLPQRQAVEVIRQVAHGKVLPAEVVEQIVAKTDGVPLFVEELTKYRPQELRSEFRWLRRTEFSHQFRFRVRPLNGFRMTIEIRKIVLQVLL